MWGILGALFSGVWGALAGLIAGAFKTKEDISLGQDQQKLVDETQTVEAANALVQTQSKIADAEANAPKTQDAVVASLDNGSF